MGTKSRWPALVPTPANSSSSTFPSFLSLCVVILVANRKIKKMKARRLKSIRERIIKYKRKTWEAVLSVFLNCCEWGVAENMYSCSWFCRMTIARDGGEREGERKRKNGQREWLFHIDSFLISQVHVDYI